MFLYLGVSGCPHICTPHTFICPICLHPWGAHIPHMPPYSSVHLCCWRLCMLVGGCNGLPFLLGHLPYTTPVWGCLPFNYTPHTQSLVPCALVCFRDISMLCGHFPSVEGFGGVPPSVGGHQHLRYPYAHSCTFFVVHYFSCFDYSSDYYSSGYSGIFWPVISDSGSFPDRVSSKLGSAWHGSTTTLDAESLWEVFLAQFLCHSSKLHLQCLLAYANYAMGSQQVGFFFRVEPPPFCILCMFGACSGVCFLLLGAELDAIFTYGGSTIRVCTFATLWSLPMAGICATW